ncbi:type II secretion system protein [Candidatus Marithrix sp. Canyon 246]|uniref:type II secretion system protein n=1 Tax=Candidatus Marithrix sp. Canyon 246 TaxID=1827136 RepID=UPI00084A10AD|nr:type II secretion system protein [Candidatus Marithrix sp. Canyon 246]
MQQQAGFTLVEIAIVLVIIGLLLTGVMKGQEIITNAKARNIENSFKQVSAAIYTYQDRYFALPGDDKKATRFGTSITKGDGNGKIEGKFDSNSQSNESNLVWLHLRNAGLIAGAKDDYTQPSNALGGIIGISSENFKGTFIGFTNIPGKVATIIEAHMDDGIRKSGSILAEPSGDFYEDGEIYSLYFAM